SLWSAAGLPIALHAGFDAFRELLNGAAAMDAHALRAPFLHNLPMRLALTGVWNQSFLKLPGHAVLPYAHRLGLMPKALQQLEMESNDKSTDLDGLPVDYPTCPILFGEPGTDGQHSFHQWLHQGATRASCDVILVANPMSREAHLEGHHDALLANGIAQSDALWHGEAHADRHRHYEGGRPVTVIVLPELDAFHLGALLALYEQKVAMQGFVWHINSFDQMGVELGKRLARERLATLGSAATPLQERLAALRRAPRPRERR
ncbi:MAG TPA: glucose-6-phosphate isomerase, partial [Usitatibacteraceae bacterium]|nr:glucose-6-phosphate isomerase [Usitatibacteraceae bacterium]